MKSNYINQTLYGGHYYLNVFRLNVKNVIKKLLLDVIKLTVALNRIAAMMQMIVGSRGGTLKK